ncbi:MAG TPA: VOC family protein [Rhizomicrobium sp.]|nr:VOC family protein [Rhizomicrobium sp.]
MSAAPAVQSLSRFSLTTADAERLAVFYGSAFGCRRLATEHLSGPAFETLMGVEGGALRITLDLGKQTVELLQFDQPGKPYPDTPSASDLVFQHFAIVVRDMAEAFRRLSARDGWTAISRGGPQRLPKSSGGVTAFKFRDPEGHPLEFLFFPEGAMPARWRERQNDENCIGIDHSAISVSNTARSVSFYENLGFRISSHSLNHGAEQEKLDDVAGAEVEVTALEPRSPDPHLELLCYRAAARSGALPCANADIATARLVLEAAGHAAPREVVDPDGHHLIVEG